MKAEADGDIQAVHRLQPVMTLRSCDVDRGWEEDRDVHGDDRPCPACQERKETQSENTHRCITGSAISKLSGALRTKRSEKSRVMGFSRLLP